jgi:hypothetical protein
MARQLAPLLLTLTLAQACQASPVADAPPPPTPDMARLARIEALRERHPQDGVLVYYQALALTALGRRDDALDALRSLVGRGLGLVPAPGIGFEPLERDAEFQALRAVLAAEEVRTPAAPVRFVLGDAALLPEGIAWHPSSRRLFVGSVAQRRIAWVEGRGRLRNFSQPADGLDAVLGLHIDQRRAQLLAVSTNGFLSEAKLARRNAVLRYSLRGPRRAQRLSAPSALQLNDVGVAADGTLYASDSEAGRLFRARPGEAELHPFTPAESLPGANGVAIAPDGALYVATSAGIARVDPIDASVLALPQPDAVVSAAIDGLYWHAGDLIGIQNVTSPGRVVRLTLADGGRRIAGLAVLQSHHHPHWDVPTTGAVAGTVLLVIANSQISRLLGDGTLIDPQTLRPTRVLAVPLSR